jgi:hypothetical protein
MAEMLGRIGAKTPFSGPLLDHFAEKPGLKAALF